MAAGVLAINKFHGGAVEEGMVLFQNISRRAKEAKTGVREAAAEVLKEMKDRGRRASGFGHRIHAHDPRTGRLFALADEAGVSGEFIRIARDCEEILREQTGKPLPINVDGAIAAVLCELGFPSEIGNAFFIIARVPGLVAHIQEEKTRMRPMRKIHPEDFAYDGPRRKE